MLNALYACLVIVLILAFSEVLLRNKIIKGEGARKFVHIFAGSTIAFLPFFVSYNWIAILGLAFIAVNLVNRYTSLFNAIHTIKRRSYGDILFGASVAVCAVLNIPEWIFATAILQVSISDGLAGLIGVKYGRNPYKILGHKKTFAGSWAFAISSLVLIVIAGRFGDLSSFYNLNALIMITPITLTLIENISGYGTDNISLPLATIFLFSLFRF